MLFLSLPSHYFLNEMWVVINESLFTLIDGVKQGSLPHPGTRSFCRWMYLVWVISDGRPFDQPLYWGTPEEMLHNMILHNTPPPLQQRKFMLPVNSHVTYTALWRSTQDDMCVKEVHWVDEIVGVLLCYALFNLKSTEVSSWRTKLKSETMLWDEYHPCSSVTTFYF